MNIYIENETDIKFEIEDADAVISRAAEHVFKDKHLPGELDVNVLITTKEGIRDINAAERGIDRPTDVLSFPYFEYETPGIFEWTIFEGEENILGDIILCAEKIKEQAGEYGHSEERELAFLVVHSMLHLTGYDHMEEEDAVLMRNEEKRLMEELNIPR